MFHFSKKINFCACVCMVISKGFCNAVTRVVKEHKRADRHSLGSSLSPQIKFSLGDVLGRVLRTRNDSDVWMIGSLDNPIQQQQQQQGLHTRLEAAPYSDVICSAGGLTIGDSPSFSEPAAGWLI